jgi:catechol 2,3-dioxygenase-like lactoylglutathione lyase family enzyme
LGQKRGKLFLGIDHTAIVVSNTEVSLRFYQDVLGLKVAGASENYGTEQEHLKNLVTEKYSFVSPGVVTFEAAQLGFSKGLLVRDPDGHVMELVQK